MRLETYYYEVTRRVCSGTSGEFHLLLHPDCAVYRGHFPGHPICPGVCNLQTIRECAEQLTGQQLSLRTLHRCRLTAVATPETCRELTVQIQLQPIREGYAIKASLFDTEHTYMTLNGELFPVSQEEGGSR